MQILFHVLFSPFSPFSTFVDQSPSHLQSFPSSFSHPPSFHLTSQSFSVSIEEGNPQGVCVPSLSTRISYNEKSGVLSRPKEIPFCLSFQLSLPREERHIGSFLVYDDHRRSSVSSQSFLFLPRDWFVSRIFVLFSRWKCVPSVILFDSTSIIPSFPFYFSLRFDEQPNYS